MHITCLFFENTVSCRRACDRVRIVKRNFLKTLTFYTTVYSSGQCSYDGAIHVKGDLKTCFNAPWYDTLNCLLKTL